MMQRVTQTHIPVFLQKIGTKVNQKEYKKHFVDIHYMIR